MELDLRALAEKLILEMWTESDRQRERAEGVKIFLREIIKEGEKLGKAENGKEQRDVPSGTAEDQK